MDPSITWIVFRHVPLKFALASLGLARSPRGAPPARSGIRGHALGHVDYVIVADGAAHPIAEDRRLLRLARHGKVVAFTADPRFGCAAAEFWEHGRRVWSIAHDAAEDPRGLSASGALPADYDAMLSFHGEWQRRRDFAGEPGDLYEELPLLFAQRVAGFRHDEPHPAIDPAGFEALVPLATPRGWSPWRTELRPLPAAAAVAG